MDNLEYWQFAINMAFSAYIMLSFGIGCIIGHYLTGVILLALVNPDVVTEILKYGFFALGSGMLLIIPLELILYGIMKAFSFFRL